MSTDREEHVISQFAGVLISEEAGARAAQLASTLMRQDAAFQKAMDAMGDVHAFVGAPEHILGNALTKHGEIAERVEVAVRSAWDYLVNNIPGATFSGVGRTAPHDYLIDGTMVQSKFINGARNTLDAVLCHYRENPTFQAAEPYYHIPRDQFANLNRVLHGDIPVGMSDHSAAALLRKIREVEALTERPFGDVVRPSLSTYAEVQQGRVHETMSRHEAELRHADGVQREDARAASAPTLPSVAGAAMKAALVGAGVRLSVNIYQKVRAGRNPFKGQFSLDDWKELGVAAAEGGIQGGVAAGAIFALTNYAGLAAPFAAAFVSSTMAVGSLARSYSAGDIDFDEFIELGQLACGESAIVAIATAVGQTMVPVPALGALAGAVAGRLFVEQVKAWACAEAERVQQAIEQRVSACVAELQDAERIVVQRALEAFDRLGKLTVAAFDLHMNGELLLQASIALAEAHGVDSDQILRSPEDVDRYMSG